MEKESNQHVDHVRGATELTVEAIIAVTDLVESVHQTIHSVGGLLNKAETSRTRGITGLVYASVRTLTAGVGKGLDAALSRLSLRLKEPEGRAPSAAQEALVSALNGVLGDYLHSRNNALAVPMQLRFQGQALKPEEIAAQLDPSVRRIVLLVHGLCMNDQQWLRGGHDHGAALARDLGVTPIYLRYNSGRHTSDNGKELAALLQSLMDSLDPAIELSIVAHSMGGLVSRSACHYAERSQQRWLSQLKHLVFLGTPHQGALLEKGGNWIDTLLDITPYSAPFARLGKIRSSGVTDLRYGNVVEEDWHAHDRFDMTGDRRTPTPLPGHVNCYTCAATTASKAGKIGDDLIGDGLVSINSALGRHKDPAMQLVFAPEKQFIGRKMNHMDLLNHPEVYAQLKQWLQ